MTDLLPFAGRFHPLLVHLPIGILLLAGVLELAAWVRRRRAGDRQPSTDAPRLESGTSAVLALGAVSAVAAAVPGYLLGTTGGYAGSAYDWHLRLGTLVAIGAIATALAAVLRQRESAAVWRRAYAVLLPLTLILLIAAGHLGATLAHGEGYLTRHAPPSLRSVLARVGIRADATPAAIPPDRAVVYTTLVEPILRSRCVSCHGPNKAEGRLRLDTPEGIRAGGDDGAVIQAGRADASELVRRIWLPAGHPDVMPPRGHRPPAPAEAAVLRWWIDQGASFDRTLADTDVPADLEPIVESVTGPIERGPAIPRVEVPRPGAAALAAARQAGFSAAPVAEGAPFLYVHCTSRPAACGDDQLGVLDALAPAVLWLDLGGTRVTDEGLSRVARLANLTRLHLQRTAITDAGLVHLEALERLEYLNLYGTRVTDEGLERLSSLGRLRSLYLWGTEVTDAGAGRLESRLPRLAIVRGASTHNP